MLVNAVKSYEKSVHTIQIGKVNFCKKNALIKLSVLNFELHKCHRPLDVKQRSIVLNFERTLNYVS